jgi:DNA-binding SARP family transcriptional activator
MGVSSMADMTPNSRQQNAPRLAIAVFGGVHTSFGGRELPLPNRKARALLAYLALSETGHERRERLAGLLWPDTTEKNARASLRQVLLDIRQVLGPFAFQAIISRRDNIELVPGAIELDVTLMLRDIAAGIAPQGLLIRSRAVETLLLGYEDLSPMLKDWVLASRARLQEQLVRALEQSYENDLFPRRQRRRLAEATLLIDPLHEAACRVVMRITAEDGEIGQSLRAYTELYNALGEELDMEPSAATQELVAEIKQGRFDKPSQPAAPRIEQTSGNLRDVEVPYAGAPVVAIMPFRSLGPDPIPSYFAEGVVEDTIRLLTALHEPVVISSNSTRQFRGEVDLQQVGRGLGAGYILSGAVRAAGPRLRLSVELADIRSGAVLWSSAYDASEPLLFDAQDDIASNIARTLVPRLRDAELRRSRGQRSEDLAAYQLMLQARELMFRLEHPAFEQAGSLLREALIRDPGYAPLYAATADWYSIRIGQGWSSDRDADMRALEAMARSAIAMDSANGRALAMLAHNRTIYRREYEDALNLIDRALGASPNDAEALMWSSPTYAYVGNTVEALRRVERAIALSPQDPFMFRYEHFVSIAHYASGAYEEAAYWGMQSLRANPLYTSNLRFTTAALVGLGRPAEARQLANKVMELDPGFRVSPMIARQAFRDDARREQYGRHLLDAGLPP